MDERIVRKVKPQAVVMMPLSLKRWLEEEADRQGTSQSAVAVEAILEYKSRRESSELTGVESDALSLAS